MDLAAWICALNALAVEVVTHGEWQQHAESLRALGGPGSEYWMAADKLEEVAARQVARLREKVDQRRRTA